MKIIPFKMKLLYSNRELAKCLRLVFIYNYQLEAMNDFSVKPLFTSLAPWSWM